ncbi:phosphotriesterase-related protein [Lactobacillus mulieris]|jgi:hydrolase|uniref:phosphotriesterase family protein n=1 Tax=Lactobacillus TaxID=1578 RepID=UPI0011799608|nr:MULTISPECIES: phosphotriesterase-related protein [Lactobacillus]KAA9243630.1 phosphotriesterase-related protein [Lactobacillus jensenii]MCW8124281.1 phosphotriesterase-related protein [Lactobacillus mulieris]MCZ9599359.1 phosphotriesterase-related protein [Lactobacillus mulieris]MDK7327496.1 phosphotriesterase-related protein [Lactobacillus mulieris]TRT38364.1 phosphotriesterase-related protein [Lactobacillus sp. c10Ua232AE]
MSKLVPGIVYAHEHIPIDRSEVIENEDTLLDSKDLIIEEFKDLYAKGVRNVIEATCRGIGRNVAYAEDVAKKTGINIVQTTGWYQSAFLPIEVYRLSVTQLVEMMINDIEVGIKGTDIKAGVIGEIATSKNKWTEQEEKVFKASVIASKETHTPIMTHTSIGTLGHEQVRFFEREKAYLPKIIIGHVDLTGDPQYILDMLKTGINVEIDTIGKNNYMPDQTRVNIIKAIEKAGYVDQVVMSMDITRKSHLKANGGNGYAYLLDTFVPMLRKSGVSDAFIHKMLIENPQRIYGEGNWND